jgi:hypothetical protein
MLSERLKDRTLYEPRSEKAFDRATTDVINKAMRKLVLVMRLLEVRDGMSRSDVEDMVVSALEKAEYLYYGLEEHELLEIAGKEKANDERREKHIKRI